MTGVTVNEDYFGDTPTTVGSMGIIGPELAITWIKASQGAGSELGGCVGQWAVVCPRISMPAPDLICRPGWMPLHGHSEARHHDREKLWYSGVEDNDVRICIVSCV